MNRKTYKINPSPQKLGLKKQGAKALHISIEDTAETEAAVQLLQDAWKKVDALVMPAVPSALEMELLISAEKRNLRSKLIRDLLLFWLSGAAILPAVLFLLFQLPIFYAGIQLLISGFAVIVLWKTSNRKKVMPRDFI